jgi:hypothetical protein
MAIGFVTKGDHFRFRNSGVCPTKKIVTVIKIRRPHQWLKRQLTLAVFVLDEIFDKPVEIVAR